VTRVISQLPPPPNLFIVPVVERQAPYRGDPPDLREATLKPCGIAGADMEHGTPDPDTTGWQDRGCPAHRGIMRLYNFRRINLFSIPILIELREYFRKNWIFSIIDVTVRLNFPGVRDSYETTGSLPYYETGDRAVDWLVKQRQMRKKCLKVRYIQPDKGAGITPTPLFDGSGAWSDAK